MRNLTVTLSSMDWHAVLQALTRDGFNRPNERIIDAIRNEVVTDDHHLHTIEINGSTYINGCRLCEADRETV